MIGSRFIEHLKKLDFSELLKLGIDLAETVKYYMNKDIESHHRCELAGRHGGFYHTLYLLFLAHVTTLA